MNSEVQKTETTLTIGSEVANLSELIAKSEGLGKLKPVMTLTADYIELEKPDDAFRGIYIGIGEINVTDKSNGILFLLLPTKQISANV